MKQGADRRTTAGNPLMGTVFLLTLSVHAGCEAMWPDRRGDTANTSQPPAARNERPDSVSPAQEPALVPEGTSERSEAAALAAQRAGEEQQLRKWWQETTAQLVAEYDHRGAPADDCPLLAGFNWDMEPIVGLAQTMTVSEGHRRPGWLVWDDTQRRRALGGSLGCAFSRESPRLNLRLSVYVFNATCWDAWSGFYGELYSGFAGPVGGELTDAKKLGMSLRGEAVFLVNPDGVPFQAVYRFHNIYLRWTAWAGQSRGVGLDPTLLPRLVTEMDESFTEEMLYPSIEASGLAPRFLIFQPAQTSVFPGDVVEYHIEAFDPSIATRVRYGTHDATIDSVRLIPPDALGLFELDEGRAVHSWSVTDAKNSIDAERYLREQGDRNWRTFEMETYRFHIANALGLIAVQEFTIDRKRPPGWNYPPTPANPADKADGSPGVPRGDDDHPGRGHDNSPPPGPEKK